MLCRLLIPLVHPVVCGLGQKLLHISNECTQQITTMGYALQVIKTSAKFNFLF